MSDAATHADHGEHHDHHQGPRYPKMKPVEVRLTDETINYLDLRMAEAVKTGIKQAMNEETARAFWATGLSVLQSQASEHAGRFVMGGMLGLFKRLMGFLVLGSIVYTLGGWTGLAKMIDVIFGARQ